MKIKSPELKRCSNVQHLYYISFLKGPQGPAGPPGPAGARGMVVSTFYKVCGTKQNTENTHQALKLLARVASIKKYYTYNIWL